MEEFGGEGAGEGFDGGLLGGGEVGELLCRAGEFSLADGFGVLLQGEDGGDVVAALEALLVFSDLVGDDDLGGGGFAAAIGKVGLGYLLEVVDVVDEAAFNLVHAGVDVAGDGDVDEEHGAVAAAFKELLAVGAGEDLLGGPGAGDDDVGTVGLSVELIVGDDRGNAGRRAELVGDQLGAGFRAVRDQDGGGALGDEVAGGELRHLAGADEQNGLALEVAKDLAREIDGDGGDGDGARADLGLVAHTFCDCEGALQEAFEGAGDGADFAGYVVRLFDLTENLRLADDHGIKRRGDAEEVADGFALAVFVEVGLEGGGGHGEVLVEEAWEVGRGGVLLEGEKLDAVAGGEDEAFGDAGLVKQSASGVGEAAGGYGEALAHVDGRGVVVDAEQHEAAGGSGLRRAHGVVNL